MTTKLTPPSNAEDPNFETRFMRARKVGYSKLIKVLTAFGLGTTAALLATGCANLLSDSGSLPVRLASFYTIGGLLTFFVTCAIQFLDPTNGDPK